MQAYARFEAIEQEIIQLLARAQISVRICVAWISPAKFQPIFSTLSSRGVKIDLIYNNDHINARSGVNLMHGVQLHPRNARRNALMHNKFCIIDERTVITGSYNWSGNAANHYENVVVIQDNFSLVKDYLHEFHDLRDLDSQQAPEYCPHCRSVVFNVVVLGEEWGKYSESQVDIWSICVSNMHGTHRGLMYEQFLEARLGLDDEHDFPGDYSMEDRESMLTCFARERARINAAQQYAAWRQVTDQNGQLRSIKLHAVGRVLMQNFNEVNKGYSDVEEWGLAIGWRDRWMRRYIPQWIDCWEGTISEIIDSQRGGGPIWR